MNRTLKSGAIVLAAGALFAVGGVSSAVAAKLITGGDIASQTITSRNLANDSVGRSELRAGIVQDGKDGKDAKNGRDGRDGKNGKNGADGLAGAVYRVANYTNGGGGRATVACANDEQTSQNYTAIAGGARVEVPGAGTATEPVTSSFPGRMNWDTNLPKPDRLDGWVVYFGEGAAPSAGNGVLEVWALCVPNDSIPTQVTNY